MRPWGERRVGWRIAVAAASVVALLCGLAAAIPASADAPEQAVYLQTPPSATGTNYLGDTLSVTPGTWWPTPTTVSYQWNREGLPIAGATSPQYAVTTADEGQAITYTVTAELGGYLPGTYTASFGTTRGPDALTAVGIVSPPVVVGTPQVGVPLTVTPGSFTPSDVDVIYEWRDEDGDQFQDAADSATFTPTDNDGGHELRLVYFATGYLDKPYVGSISFTQVLPQALAASNPSITGSQLVGSTLTANGNWNATPDSVDYQWTSDGVDIDGATSSVYTTTDSDIGNTIGVTMTAHLSTLDPLTVTPVTPWIVSVPFATTPQPTISGVAQLDSTLTVDAGDWGEPGATFTYNWYLGGKAVTTTSSNSWTFTESQNIGQQVTVTVTATAPGFGPTTSDMSEPTAPIAPLPGKVSSASIGPAQVGEPMSVTYTLSDISIPDAVSYSWLRNGVAIPGATQQTYIPQFADLGTHLSVVVSLADPDYASIATISNTEVVAEGYASGGVTVTGAMRVGSTVGVTLSGWPPPPITFRYAWYTVSRDGEFGFYPLSNSSSYTIPASLLGVQLEVWVQGHKAGYFPATATWYNSLPETVLPGQFSVQSPPVVTGLPTVGARLVASAGVVSPASGSTFRYQWFSALSSGATPIAIPGATSSSYVPTAAMAHRFLSVRVTVSRTAYTSTSTFSAVTGAVLLPAADRLVHPPFPPQSSVAP